MAKTHDIEQQLLNVGGAYRVVELPMPLLDDAWLDGAAANRDH